MSHTISKSIGQKVKVSRVVQIFVVRVGGGVGCRVISLQ